MDLFINIALVILAYSMGSICSAVLVARIFHLSDPRDEGSKNPGATNVLRLHGKKYAAIVLLADMFKATIPVLIAHIFKVNPAFLGWVGFAAVLGHIYPIFFKFNGGKGVASALGAYLGINFFLGISCLALWIITAKFKKYSSLASVLTMIVAPIISLSILKTTDILLPMIAISFIVIAKHRLNIERLIEGRESKLKF